MAGHTTTVALACIFAVAFSGAFADRPEKLVRGTDAVNNEYPYMVSLRFKNQHFCGGAIIGPKYVITAAHCVESMKKFPKMFLTAVVGTNHLDKNGDSYRIESFKQHDKYEHQAPGKGWDYDLGIVKLVEPIKYSAVVKAVPLPVSGPDYKKPATVSAWGATKAPKDPVNKTLQKLDLPLVQTDTCQEKHKSKITDILICTFKATGTGTCSGDSGSPLVQNGHLIGVVSGGIPCAVGVPDIFTNVYKLLDFVNKSMKE